MRLQFNKCVEVGAPTVTRPPEQSAGTRGVSGMLTRRQLLERGVICGGRGS
jgi:hypothetical protein